ncbi:MAG: hypothetical protein J6N56_03085 [Bacteroidales bacterium]|nr:hypothetical protein [Bacteroidales bacterium]
MRMNSSLLLLTLTKQTVLHHIGHILLSDGQIRITVLHLQHHLRSESKLLRLVNHLLNAEHKGEAALRTLLAKRLEHLQILIKLANGGVSLQVSKQLVNNNEKTLIRVLLLECDHHLIQLLAVHLQRIRVKLIHDSQFIQITLNLEGHDVPKFPVCLHLKPMHFELACNRGENILSL